MFRMALRDLCLGVFSCFLVVNNPLTLLVPLCSPESTKHRKMQIKGKNYGLHKHGQYLWWIIRCHRHPLWTCKGKAQACSERGKLWPSTTISEFYEIQQDFFVTRVISTEGRADCHIRLSSPLTDVYLKMFDLSSLQTSCPSEHLCPVAV